MALFEVHQLEKIYGTEVKTPALRGVSLSIERGEFVAIMGPSGSGKSTLLHILGLLDEPTSGTFRFDGTDVATLSEIELARMRNEKMGFVFQAFNLLAKTNVLENVMLPLLYSRVPETQWTRRAKSSIAAVTMVHRVGHEPSQLSGGEKQRVAIARALVTGPDVIFADEPTGNLDSKSGQNVIEILQALNEQGTTVVLITHETYTAETARRIIRLKDGVIESDTAVAKRRQAKDGFKK